METAFFQFAYIVGCSVLIMHFTSGFKKGFIKICAIFQHSIYDDKKLAGEGNNGFFRALLLFEFPVPGRQITVTLARNDPRNLTEHAFDIRVAFSDGSAFALACALIVTGGGRVLPRSRYAQQF